MMKLTEALSLVSSIHKLITRGRHGAGKHTGRRLSRRTTSRRPSLEALESRSLLSSSPLLMAESAATSSDTMALVAAAQPVAQAATQSAASFYSSFTTGVTIPDGPVGAWVGWDIDARSLPAGATVTSVTVHHKFTHPRIGDLQVKLYNDTGTTWLLRLNLGGKKTNLDETRTDTTVLAGDPASQVWHYRVRDTAATKAGRLTRLEVTINYQVDPVRLASTSISATTARDGQTLTLGYQLTSTTDTTVTLGATLVSPSGRLLADAAHNLNVQVTPGTNWYYRPLPINLPPEPELGSYDVMWELSGSQMPYDFAVADAGLTIQSPVAVRIPILMYHNIKTGSEVDGVDPQMFRAQLEALKAYGYTTVTEQELMNYRAGLDTPPAKPVMLTFDDGYADLYTQAYPILADPALRAKATAYIFTEGVETDPAIVTWPQLQAMEDSGLVEIESHTVSHPHLTRLTPAQLTAELVNSKQILESHLGKEIRYISWPYGDYNDAVRQAAWQAGYAGGPAAWGGLEQTSADKFALRRFSVLRATSLDYDPAHPENFLFSLIEEPSVVVPQISLNSILYLDPANNQPLTVDQVLPGQQVKVRVSATNTGNAANILATLQLDSDNNPANGVSFDSHTATPVQDLARVFGTGTQAFEWIWQVPNSAMTSQFSARVTFRDQHYVLGFFDSGWRPAFSVVAATAAALPTSSLASPTTAAVAMTAPAITSDSASAARTATAPAIQPASASVTSPSIAADRSLLKSLAGNNELALVDPLSDSVSLEL